LSDSLKRQTLVVIGGGLAGCEAAWQAAERGVKTRLFEMKPSKYSPAHKSPLLAELVCSNSLRAKSLESAVGLLKEELRRLGSIIMRAAIECEVPAGRSLAVDRDSFSGFITDKIRSHPYIEVVQEEVTSVQALRPLIIATGPLSSEAIVQEISRLTEPNDLYFYDAISPIVYADSIDYSKVFKASRWQEDEGDYLNCPMNEEEYRAFYTEMLNAEQSPLREFEERRFFEGCLPIEVMANRGYQTLLFGPMKPVGLVDPHTGRRPFAVVQLRQDDKSGSLWNMVGFQTKMKYKEQERIFRMIPGLETAQFARLGSIHRNTFINGPKWLTSNLSLKDNEDVFLAGQITGVEGYVESTAMGLLAGINAARGVLGGNLAPPPPETAIGALVSHLTTVKKDFQPMNVNFGLFPDFEQRAPKKQKRAMLAVRALARLEQWRENLAIE